MSTLLVLLLIVGSALSCIEDEPDAVNLQAFTKANQGSWFGRYEIAKNEFVDLYWLITPDGRILSWKGEFDGHCFKVSEDKIDVEMNTKEQFVFVFKGSDGKEYAYTLTKDGPKLKALINDGQQTILVHFIEASTCYSTGGLTKSKIFSLVQPFQSEGFFYV